MKAYLFLVISAVGFYAVFTGRAKNVLCALMFGSDGVLNCGNMLTGSTTPPGPVTQVVHAQFYPGTPGYD